MAERQNICDHSIQNNCIDIFMCLVVLTDPENTQLIKKNVQPGGSSKTWLAKTSFNIGLENNPSIF